MNLKNLFLKGSILALMACLFISCSDDDTTVLVDWNPYEGAYILNAGKSSANNSALSFFNKGTKVVSVDVFSAKNEEYLGSLGQDMLISGDKMYIAVYNSGIIYVTDLHTKIIKKIVSEKSGQKQGPRSFAEYGDYIYVTYYDGYLARINKNTLELDSKQVAVGSNPENVKVAKGKAYVACSGGLNRPNYDNKVSVVDLASFEKIDDITVALNPTTVEVDKQESIYVISMGNYGNVPNTLQRINTTTDKVDMEIGNATFMRMNPAGNKLYTIYSQWGDPNVKYNVFNTETAEMEDGYFVDSSVEFAAAPVAINFDPNTNDIYIGTSNYAEINEMYIISSTTGKLIHKFSAGGISPIGAYFVK